MGRVTAMFFAGAATLLSVPAASAADMPMMPPMRPAIVDFSGWYLRGDIGMSNQQVGSLFSPTYTAAGTTVTNVNKSFDAAPFFGLGVGYQVNNWLRFDVTGEYRARANFHGADNVRSVGSNWNFVGTDSYTGAKSEWTALVNAYVDLGTWWSVTPFIGAGVGASYNRISNFTDIGLGNCAGAGCAVAGSSSSIGYAPDVGKWNLAWALHAGLAYRVTPAVTVEFAYRYLDLGKAQVGDLVGYDGSNGTYNPVEFRSITSHDLKLGVRWMLWEPEPAYPPLMRKG